MPSRLRDAAALLLFVLVAAVVAGFAAQFQPGPWYDALRKPPGNPPAWVFGPVWTALYLAMAISAWLVWRTRDPRSPMALRLWATQLLLNGMWSWLFFGQHRMGAAFVEIVVLEVAIVATAISFCRVRPAAGWLMVPYAFWVGFASYLNAGLWWANRAG